MPVFFENSSATGGGEDTIIKTYIASADGAISAGDLCEFVDNKVRKTKLKTATMGLKTDLKANNRNIIKATVLDNTRVLLVTNDAGTNLYGQVLSIDEVNGIITKGVKAQLTTMTVLMPGYDVCAVNATVALVGFKNTADNSWNLLPLTITGTTISVGSIVANTNHGNITEIALEKFGTNSLVMFMISGGYLHYVGITVTNSIPSFGTFLDNFITDTYYTTTKLKASKIESSNPTYNYYLVERHGVYNYNGTTPQNDQLLLSLIRIPIATITSGTNMVGDQFNTGIERRATDYSLSNSLFGEYTFITTNVNTQFLVENKHSYVLNLDGTVADEFPTLAKYFMAIFRQTVTNVNIYQYEKGKYIVSYTGNPYGPIKSFIMKFDGLNCAELTPHIQQNQVNSKWIETLKLNSGCLLNFSVDPTDSNFVRCDLQQELRGNPRPFKVLGFEDPRCVALNNAVPGDPVKVLIKGIKAVGILLQPGAKYYCDENGNLTTSVTPYFVGTAINATELSIVDAWWDRGL